ncbi:protein HAPLESS 2 isoform X1 [Populus alba x Populus x berolinensis]|uniref:Protein HAPLESS 2 isoform X1 n=1 Tax=Populus alba x Populus x berolinensis TaxID=444605 RepID=A0AAD6RKJ8_9ROSI|nr:protein HAPLESS 2 isoform X1 [Populus alba x Populus x berolinensis]
MRRHYEVIFFIFCIFLNYFTVQSIEILSKSKLERCEKASDSDNDLNCTRKIVLNMAVPSGSSGGEASIVAEIAEVEENATNLMETVRVPPVITINKTAAYALYELTYIRDVAYKPEEYYVKTRKCDRDAGANVVKICESHSVVLVGPNGGRQTDEREGQYCTLCQISRFHVFGIGQRSMGFSVRIEVKTGSKVSEVTVGPENRTVTSKDNFLRVNLIGDFVGYSNIPSFEDFYLVIPRQGEPGQPQDPGRNFSMWMLLERVRFTLDGVECNKIGVSYEAFSGQPNFCASPFWSCLHNQLWNFHDADQNRIRRKQLPLYGVEGRFERINQHPNAGTHSFSIGITEVLNTNLLIELTADDIEYVYQRSPGKLLSFTIPTFEALTQFGVATVSAENIGEVEASYSLTFDCSRGVSLMEEQFFILKPNEITIRSFKIYPTTDKAARYVCAAILKDSGFNEIDRAECQFLTTATILDNGSQIAPFLPPKTSVNGFFESIENIWNRIWEGLVDFITGKTCRQKCSSFFDFSCHIQYVCMSWMVMFGLLLAIFPTVLVLLWLLHQKGLFDPLYDWWEDHLWTDEQRIRDTRRHNKDIHVNRHHELGARQHKHNGHKRRTIHQEHRHRHSGRDTEYYHYLHHVHKDKSKHRGSKKSSVKQQVYLDGVGNTKVGHHRHRKERDHGRTVQITSQK